MDFLTNPFIVVMLFLYQLFGGSLILAILAFTVLTRVVTFPLTAQQLKSSKKMQEVAPKLQALKEKYKGDREKMAAAQMELYRENGVNPLAGCLPLVIQMPVLFGLYGAIYAALGSTPLQLIDVSHRLLIPNLSKMLPLKTQFLWLNLGAPDPIFLLPILVVATTWLQSKLMTPTPTDPKDPSAATARTMTTIMPLMIGLFSLSFASGLSIYWIVSNVVGIAQYAILGQADFRRLFGRAPAPVAAVSTGKSTGKVITTTARAVEPAPKKRIADEASESGGTSRTARTKKALPSIDEYAAARVGKLGKGESGFVAYEDDDESDANQKQGKAPGKSADANRKTKPGAPKTAGARKK